MSKKKNFRPQHKSAPHLPAEPPDIDELGHLSESEKAVLANTVTQYGQAAGQGVSPIPAEFKPTADTEKVKAFMQAPVSTHPKGIGAAMSPIKAPVSKEEVRQAMKDLSDTEELKPLFTPEGRRAYLVEDFSKLIKNIELGAPLFNGLDPFTIANVASYMQEALIDYVLDRPPQSFQLPRLNPLLLRDEEDKHNRRCLLALCHRLDISAEDLTLAMLKENLAKEAWRLGESAVEIPYLEINTQNEQEWRAYKEELGLVKRRKQ